MSQDYSVKVINVIVAKKNSLGEVKDSGYNFNLTLDNNTKVMHLKEELEKCFLKETQGSLVLYHKERKIELEKNSLMKLGDLTEESSIFIYYEITELTVNTSTCNKISNSFVTPQNIFRSNLSANDKMNMWASENNSYNETSTTNTNENENISSRILNGKDAKSDRQVERDKESKRSRHSVHSRRSRNSKNSKNSRNSRNSTESDGGKRKDCGTNLQGKFSKKFSQKNNSEFRNEISLLKKHRRSESNSHSDEAISKLEISPNNKDFEEGEIDYDYQIDKHNQINKYSEIYNSTITNKINNPFTIPNIISNNLNSSLINQSSSSLTNLNNTMNQHAYGSNTLKDLLKRKSNSSFSMASDSMSDSSFEKVMKSRKNEKNNNTYKFTGIDVEMKEMLKGEQEVDVDSNKNSLLKQILYPINNNYNFMKNKNPPNFENHVNNNKLRAAFISYLESNKKYKNEYADQKEANVDNISNIIIENKVESFANNVNEIISEFTFIENNNFDNEEISKDIKEIHRENQDPFPVPDIFNSNFENIEMSLSKHYNIMSYADSSEQMSMEDLKQEKELGEIDDDDQIIDINQIMNIDDEIINCPKNDTISIGNISMDIVMANKSLNASHSRDLISPMSIDTPTEVPNFSAKKQENSFKNIFYNSYFEENIDPNDHELTQKIQEIDNLMKSIVIHEETKSTMRVNNDATVSKTKNKKEGYFNNSFLFFYLNSFPLSSLSKKLKNREFKLNLILDIDSTILFAEHEKNLRESAKADSILIEPVINNTTFRLRLKIRKNTAQMLKRVASFCNFYIYTHGKEAYAIEVVKVIKEEIGIMIKDENVIGIKHNNVPVTKCLRHFSCDPMFKANSLVLDDNAKAWDPENFSNLIQSMKFIGFMSSIKFDEKQYRQSDNTNGPSKVIYSYMLLHNRLAECDDYQCNLIDENNAPYSVEYDHSTISQMDHICNLIENVYKLSVLQNMTAEESLRNIRQNVLVGISINLRFASLDEESLKIIKEMILVIGGKYEESDKICSHYIISNTEINQFENHRQRNAAVFKNKKNYFLKLKWLFHCFFFIKKMNEGDAEYKVIM